MVDCHGITLVVNLSSIKFYIWDRVGPGPIQRNFAIVVFKLHKPTFSYCQRVTFQSKKVTFVIVSAKQNYKTSSTPWQNCALCVYCWHETDQLCAVYQTIILERVSHFTTLVSNYKKTKKITRIRVINGAITRKYLSTHRFRNIAHAL